MTFPKNVVVPANEKGHRNSNFMEDWIKMVWCWRPGVRNVHNILVIDAFKRHVTENVENALKKTNTDTVMIPGGMTRQLQPLDVSVNKPFKL